MLATVAAADSASTVRKKSSVFIYSEAEPYTMYAICKKTRPLCVLQYKVFPSQLEIYVMYVISYCCFLLLDLWFEYKVFPSQLEIYETYIPGAVVRILACDTTPGESRNDIPTEVR